MMMSILVFPLLVAQQVADSTYNPIIHELTYEFNKGPVVFIDEGHHNFHTKNGRYKAFANLLERDGYRVRSYGKAFDQASLQEGKILVISNASVPPSDHPAKLYGPSF